jgi:hypothetical protein
MPATEDQRPAGGGESAQDDDPAYQRARRAELERRIAALAGGGAEAFGRIGWGDGLLVTVLFLLAPALAIWLFR